MGQKILVVDDSKTICRVVQWVYYASPFRVESAHTAAEALVSARAHRPAAILVDYQLPDATGFDLVRQLRADPELRGVAIVMLGGSFHPFEPADVARCGADDFVMKPFTADALMDAVNAAIAGERRAPEPVAPPEPIAPREPVAPPAREELEAPPAVAESPRPSAPHLPPPPSHTPVVAQPSVPAAPQRPPLRPAPPAPAATGGFRRPSALDETVRRRPMVPPAPAPLRPSSPVERPQAVTLENEALQAAAEDAPVAAPVAAPVDPAPTPHAPEPILSVVADVSETSDAPATEETTTTAPEADPSATSQPPASAEAIEAALRELLPTLLAAHNLASPTGPAGEDLRAALREVLPGLLRELLPSLVKDVLGSMLKQTGTRMEEYSRQKIDHFCANELPRLASEALSSDDR